jgi:hypothetical protein
VALTVCSRDDDPTQHTIPTDGNGDEFVINQFAPFITHPFVADVACLSMDQHPEDICATCPGYRFQHREPAEGTDYVYAVCSVCDYEVYNFPRPSDDAHDELCCGQHTPGCTLVGCLGHNSAVWKAHRRVMPACGRCALVGPAL